MVKHILGMSIWMSGILFFLLFAGEFMIPESELKWRCFNLEVENCEYADSPYVFPGRLEDWEGNDLYATFAPEFGPSRHLTFIFTVFVLMQIFNMICCRTIHDELNIFKGVHTNFMFILIWVIIMVG